MLISLSSWPKRRRPNTTGSRTAPKPFVSDSQWNIIKDLFEDRILHLKADDRELMRERVSKAFCGCSRTERDGKIYQRSIHLLPPVGVDIRHGQKPDCWSKPGKG